LVSPNSTINYIISVSDGCSDETLDTIPIFVFNTFDLDFITSEKRCFGEIGFAKVNANPPNNIIYQWNTNPIINGDSINQLVNRNYIVTATNTLTNCNVIDTVRILGYDKLIADFSPNTTECLSLLDANIQFIDRSLVNPNEINSNSFWDFGDGTILPYTYSLNPTNNYVDTGQYQISLYLINEGGCIDSASLNICVIPESKIFIPNSFTPDNDMCNDFFYVKALGLFYEFNIKIYNRWNSKLIFESSEILLTNDLLENSMCDNNNINPFYKMGEWNGNLMSGKKAPLGVYVYEINYKKLKDSKNEVLFGTITLVR